MDENGATFLSDLQPMTLEESEAAPSGLPMYFIVLSGGIPGAMLRLFPGGTKLGRASDNNVQLPDSSVSRRHALLKVDSDGKARLTDLGSTNGTFVNGRRVPMRTTIVLQDGDRLRFGSNVLVKFVRPDPCEERFQREMFERTVRDSLTGLFNRVYFHEQVALLLENGASQGLGLAILLLDIDHFKQVNDTFGHDAGDEVLREVATVLRNATRSEDLVARYGGEEFIAALPIASPPLASERAERIRASLAGRTIQAAGRTLKVTASIGLAFAPPGFLQPIAELISAADIALYEAKKSGRDRVVGGLAQPSPLNSPGTSCDVSIDWEQNEISV